MIVVVIKKNNDNDNKNKRRRTEARNLLSNEIYFISDPLATNPDARNFPSLKIKPSRSLLRTSSKLGFKCGTCGRCYSLKHNLLRHVRFECGGQRCFQCYLCSNTYTQNASLHRHLMHCHNVDVKNDWKKLPDASR